MGVEPASPCLAQSRRKRAPFRLVSIRLDRRRDPGQAVNPEVAGSSPVEPAIRTTRCKGAASVDDVETLELLGEEVMLAMVGT
jgi:hypothetical protein